MNFSVLAEQLNLFHREFYEPKLPTGWTREVIPAGQASAPQDLSAGRSACRERGRHATLKSGHGHGLRSRQYPHLPLLPPFLPRPIIDPSRCNTTNVGVRSAKAYGLSWKMPLPASIVLYGLSRRLTGVWVWPATKIATRSNIRASRQNHYVTTHVILGGDVMGRSRIAALLLVSLAVLLLAADGQPRPQESASAGQGPSGAAPTAVLVPIPLPLSGATDMRLKNSLGKLLKALPAETARPIVIFEFRPSGQADGYTGDFEPALALARYLASDRFSRVRTVAYLPATVEGHAVLAVLACEEIIIAPQAQLGAAGRGEPSIGPTMEAAYREMAERRRTIPVPLVLAMLDPRTGRVRSATGGWWPPVCVAG